MYIKELSCIGLYNPDVVFCVSIKSLYRKYFKAEKRIFVVVSFCDLRYQRVESMVELYLSLSINSAFLLRDISSYVMLC